MRGHHRKVRIDLFASGDGAAAPMPRGSFLMPVSRMRPPRMLGVCEQNGQIYTLGIVRRVTLMQRP